MPKIETIYEDNYLLIINKPSGMVVNRAESVVGETIQDWAEAKLKTQMSNVKTESQINLIFLQRAGIAHRLDKETSGCLLIAKDPETLKELMRQFKAREVQKTYLALVHGKVEPQEGWWYWPIKRGDRDKREEFRVQADGRLAYTKYQVIEYGQKMTYLQCNPVTGRTHQIRVHAMFAGHPLAADAVYGNKSTYKADLKWCPRHFLHAHQICFIHPYDKSRLKAKADLPADLKGALEYVFSN